MQRPGDNNAARTANYDRARACVAACWFLDDPVKGLRELLDGAQVAVSVLPLASGLRRDLAELLQRAEQPVFPAVPA